jgi:hypothetical protein
MPRDQVFISYGHKDKKWHDDLDTNLKPYLRGGSIVSWSDQQITPGSAWFREIQSALTNSKVAVLLVSPDFLASDFVHEHELGPLLKEAEQGGGIKILWVPVRDSAYHKTALKDYQAVLDPGTPLAKMMEADRDSAWVRICEKIEKAVSEAKTAKAITNIELRQNEQAQQIKLLRFFIANFIGKYELMHLEGLERGRPYPFDCVRPTFEEELVRLRSFGLIDHIQGKGIRAMKQEGQGDLNDHFRITDLGKDYLELRREVVSEVKESVESTRE